MGVPWADWKSENFSFWNVINNNESFLNQIVTYDEKWILYNNRRQPAQWLDREEAPKHFPRSNPKHFPKSNLYKNRSWPLFGGLLPSSPLQLSEFWQNHYIWEVCSANGCTENWNAFSQQWSTKIAQFFSMTTPDCTSYNKRFKGSTNWAKKFCLICYIHLTSCQPPLQLFAGKMRP